MNLPFVSKLRHGAPLSETEEQCLSDLAKTTQRIEARRDIQSKGDVQRSLILMVEGWACRYQQLENGRRQLISLMLPGDLSEPFGVLPRFQENSLGTLTTAVVARVPLHVIQRLADDHSHIREALWWDLLVASAIEREHIVSLGRRSASERLGHLFCELHLRLSMVGLVDNLGYDMPVTQADLGDLLGLSAVHLNRSFQELRRMRLVSSRGRRLIINNLAELREFSCFESGYLHPHGSVSR